MILLNHADFHIEDMVRKYIQQGVWQGCMTVIRPADGKEYAWPRLLSEREIRVMTQHFSGQEWAPRGVPKSGVFDVYQENGSWRARIGRIGHAGIID